MTYDLELGAGIRTAPIQHVRPYALLPGQHPLASRPYLDLTDLEDTPVIEYAHEPRSSGQFLRESGLSPVVAHHFTSSILLWVRTDQPRQTGMDCWKGPHSGIISATKGLEEYLRIHMAADNPRM